MLHSFPLFFSGLKRQLTSLSAFGRSGSQSSCHCDSGFGQPFARSSSGWIIPHINPWFQHDALNPETGSAALRADASSISCFVEALANSTIFLVLPFLDTAPCHRPSNRSAQPFGTSVRHRNEDIGCQLPAAQWPNCGGHGTKRLAEVYC